MPRARATWSSPPACCLSMIFSRNRRPPRDPSAWLARSGSCGSIRGNCRANVKSPARPACAYPSVESPDFAARACWRCLDAPPSGNDAEAGAHQSDTVEVGLFARALFGAFARLIAFVQELDLLELLEGLGQQVLGIFELNAQLVGGPRQIFPALDRRLGVGRVGEVRGIVDSGAFLLALDLALEIDRHALEIGNHAFDLGNPSALLVDLKLLQADQRFA